MCIVFLSFLSLHANFFSCLGEKATVHITHEGRRRKEYEDMVLEHEKFWKFFSNFSSQPHDCPPPRFEWWKVLRDFGRGANSNMWAGWECLEVALYCYISSSICIYLFFCTNILFCSIFMYTTGLGCFFGAQEEWKASRVKFIAGMEVYVGLKVFDTFVEILWRLWEIDFYRIQWNLCDWITDSVVDSLKEDSGLWRDFESFL